MADPSQSYKDVGILRTKLHRPRIAANVVKRDRLYDRLERGRKYPLTLVSAPAGYGKSTLVSLWLEEQDDPSAWLSLDASESDFVEFLNYLVASVRTAFAGSCAKTRNLLLAAKTPPSPVLARSLVNDLDCIDTPFILVIDDYHRIAPTSPVNEILRHLLEQPPLLLHLVLVTRRDPPLPLAQFRAGGLMTDIRLQDLQLTMAEMAIFLEQSAGLRLNNKLLASLHEKIEGWAVGLRLVALAAPHQEDPKAFVSNLTVSLHDLRTYLLQEVLAGQKYDVQMWLLRTAVLNRFCSALCEAVSMPEDRPEESGLSGDLFIQVLQSQGLFSIPLDANGIWFRYHHLFQELLKVKLERQQGPDKIRILHLRASGWFEAEGMIDEALRHALAAKDANKAAQMYERTWRGLVNDGRRRIIAKRLALLPDEVVQQRPELLLAKAWILYDHLDFTTIPTILDQIDDLLESDAKTDTISGEIAMFRGFCSFLLGESARSMDYLRYALERIPVTDVEFRSMCELLFGVVGQMEGARTQVTRQLVEWLNQSPSLHPLREVSLLWTLTCLRYISGDPQGAKRYTERQRAVARSHGKENYLAWSDYFEGLFHLQHGEIDAAIGLLERAAERKYSHYTRGAADALAALTLAYQARGRSEQADASWQSLCEFTNHIGQPSQVYVDSCAARLAILQGRPEVAVGWLETSASPPAQVMICWLEIPCITWCRSLLAEGSAESLKEANRRLREYAKLCESHHNTLHLIEILLLQAVACEKQGDTEESLGVLGKAVTLALPGTIIFPFLELGRPIGDLLRRVPRRGTEATFIKRILSAMIKAKEKSAEVAEPSHAISLLVETLTNREQEILELLAKRYRDKEIAEQLFISPITVKSHLAHIYQKLQVGNRRQAVVRATEVGLLSRD